MHQICIKSLYCHILHLAPSKSHLKTCARIHPKIMHIYIHTPTKSTYCIHVHVPCAFTPPSPSIMQIYTEAENRKKCVSSIKLTNNHPK